MLVHKNRNRKLFKFIFICLMIYIYIFFYQGKVSNRYHAIHKFMNVIIFINGFEISFTITLIFSEESIIRINKINKLNEEICSIVYVDYCVPT